ncbi:hypothetical protein PLESTB_001520900 [Pleodorina starrii]|uniref:Uncharacterized protein n=1 Tax=Pleodorina starrii TaxID=330485 RepID=A0A9W6BX26_9CHLO|nr:hypothetical protein PLESTM_001866900 [Pleodorina starrii]GLC59673.1 hypothetical protein PLESTB_001520900 [Pleodorina starrii]GLC74638.1 hypothetical protein PLESTF_001538200 [Pleodorina starrii]
MEMLVQQLADGGLLASWRPTRSVIRENLYCLGFRPALVCESHKDSVRGADSWIIRKAPYLKLSLPASKSYQGRSNSPEEFKGTYVGSYTWAELQLYDSDGKVVSTSGDPRLYTNLHADSRRQTFFVLLGTDSELVDTMNRCVFAPSPPAAAVDAMRQAMRKQELEASLRNGSITQKAVGVHELVFEICAQYPAWRHFIYGAKMVVHLRPAECNKATGAFSDFLDIHRKQQANAPYSESPDEAATRLKAETKEEAGAAAVNAEAVADEEESATSQLEQAKFLMLIMSDVKQEDLEKADTQGLLDLQKYARLVLDSEPGNKNALALMERLNQLLAAKETGKEEAPLMSLVADSSTAPATTAAVAPAVVDKAVGTPPGATPAVADANEAEVKP